MTHSTYSSIRSRTWRLTLAAVIITAAAVPFSLPVAAQDSEPTSAAASTTLGAQWATAQGADNTWALPLDALGYGPTIIASVSRPIVEIDVPTVAGLTSHRFETVLTAGDHAIDVEIRGGEEPLVLRRLSPHQRVELSTPLPAATTFVTVAVQPVDNDDCGVLSHSDLLHLRDSVAFYSGEPAVPTNLDSFFGPALGSVRFVVDEVNDQAAEAVLDATARLAARYPAEQAITVTDSAEPAGTPAPFARTIRITGDSAAGLSLDDGTLVISGTESSLLDQVAALSTGLVGAVGATEAVVVDRSAEPEPSRFDEKVPIGELTNGRLEARGAYRLELGVDLDQTFFGGPVGEYRVRLGGIATPPPGRGERHVQLALQLDGDLEELIEIDADGRFDIEFAIPPDRIGRHTLVELVLHGPRECGDPSQWQLQIDRGSWVHALAGDAVEPGFERFPQTTEDSVNVYRGVSARHLAIAAGMVGQLQDASTRALDVHVVSRSEAITETGALVAVAADPDMLTALGAPLNPSTGVAVDTDLRAGVRTGIEMHLERGDADLSAIQSFVSASGADAMVINMPIGIAATGLPAALMGGRWTSIDAAIGIVNAAGEIIEIPNARSTDTPSAQLEELGSTARGPRQLFASGFALAGIVAVVIFAKIRVARFIRGRLQRNG